MRLEETVTPDDLRDAATWIRADHVHHHGRAGSICDGCLFADRLASLADLAESLPLQQAVLDAAVAWEEMSVYENPDAGTEWQLLDAVRAYREATDG